MSEMVPLNQRLQTVREFLDAQKGQLALAATKHLSPDRLVRLVLTECLRNPTLLECSRESFAGAVLQLVALGLEVGPLGQAYLIPFKNNRKGGIREIQLIPGYKGLALLARRSGMVAQLEMVTVHAKDRFKIIRGSDPRIIHEPFHPAAGQPYEPGESVAYYAVAHVKGGGRQFEAMWRREVEVHRDRFSRAAGEGPWVTDFDPMAMKTVLRKLFKLLPASTELQTAIVLDEHAEAGIPQDLGMLVDGGLSVTPGEPTSVTGPASKPVNPVAARQSTLAAELKAKAEQPPPAPEAAPAGVETGLALAQPDTESSWGPAMEPVRPPLAPPDAPARPTAARGPRKKEAPALVAPPAPVPTVELAPLSGSPEARLLQGEAVRDTILARIAGVTGVTDMGVLEDEVYTSGQWWPKVLPAHRKEINAAFEARRLAIEDQG